MLTHLLVVTDRISEGGNAIAFVRPSVCFHSIFGTDWNFCTWVGHDHSSQGIEGQGHESRSKLRVRLVRSVRHRSRAVFPRLGITSVYSEKFTTETVGTNNYKNTAYTFIQYKSRQYVQGNFFCIKNATRQQKFSENHKLLILWDSIVHGSWVYTGKTSKSQTLCPFFSCYH